MKRTVPQFDVRSSPDTLSSASAWAWSSMLPNELTPCIEESSIVASDSHDRVRSTLAFPRARDAEVAELHAQRRRQEEVRGFYVPARNDAVAKLPRGRRLSCGRVDDVEATRHRDNAIV